MKVFKYNIDPKTPENVIDCPVGMKPLSVTEQSGKIVMWAVVDDQATKNELHKIHVVGTGVDSNILMYPYVGAVQVRGESTAYHVFDGGTV